MAKGNSLLPETFDRDIARGADTEPAPKRAANGGKYHLGAYFDPAAPIVQEFRMLAARTHRRQQDLLEEAITLLIDKHRAAEAFGK